MPPRCEGELVGFRACAGPRAHTGGFTGHSRRGRANAALNRTRLVGRLLGVAITLRRVARAMPSGHVLLPPQQRHRSSGEDSEQGVSGGPFVPVGEAASRASQADE